jgi:hypothetical protein
MAICKLTRIFIIVIPAKAGIQLQVASAPSWTPTFVGGDESWFHG